MPSSRNESQPLLPANEDRHAALKPGRETIRAATFSVLAFLVIWLVTFRGIRSPWSTYEPGPKDLPSDPLQRARALLQLQPVIDGVCSVT